MDMRGDPAHPLYASSFVREAGPAWAFQAPVVSRAFRDSLGSWAARGFLPVRVSALDGAGAGEPVFAAILEKDSTPTLTSTGLDRAAFQGLCDSAQRNQSKCVWMDAYGTAAQPRFAGIWKRKRDFLAWNYSYGDDEKSLRGKMDVFSRVWVRPAFFAPLPDGRYFTLWEENSIGAWAAHASLDPQALRESLEREGAHGLHPLCLQALPGPQGGFSVLLAERGEPLPRRWTVSGPASPGLEAFDGYVRGLMQANGVRAGALAVARDGKLVLAHGYTWSETGYPETRANSVFRVASCSKPLTSILVHRLLRGEAGQDGGPSLKGKILSLLHPQDDAKGGPVPAAKADAPADARFGDITVDQLLTHSGGWVRSRQNPDPVFNDYPMGSEIRNRLPTSRKDFLKYMLGQPLQFDPGSKSVYDNFGYFLLGRMLESLPMGMGRSYEGLAEDLIFHPLGLSRPRFGGSRYEERIQGEVLYHTAVPYLQINPDSKGSPWVPGGYGDFDLRNMDAAGAWLLSAPDYAKVLASFDLGPYNPILNPQAVATMWAPSGFEGSLRGWFALKLPRADGGNDVAKWHNGLFPGTSSLVFYRPDKLSFVLFLNRDVSPQPDGPREGRDLSRLADGIRTWPAQDLFPETGIPAFVPGPQPPAPGSAGTGGRTAFGNPPAPDPVSASGSAPGG